MMKPELALPAADAKRVCRPLCAPWVFGVLGMLAGAFVALAAMRRESGWMLAGLLFASAAIWYAQRTARRGSIVRDEVDRRQALDERLRRLDELARLCRTYAWEMDATGLYTKVGHAVSVVLGYAPVELEGTKRCYDLLPEQVEVEVRSFARDLFARGEEFSGFVNPKVAKSGALVWVSTHAIPLRDGTGMLEGFHGLDVDVTETIHAEMALQASEQRYRLLTESMQDAVWILDVESFRVLYASPSIEALLGTTVQEVMAWPIDAIMNPEEREGLRGLLRMRSDAFRAGRVLSTTFFLNEVTLRRRDGSFVPTEITSRYWRNAATGAVELHGTLRDISARKRLQAYRDLSPAILQIVHQPGNFETLLQDVAEKLAEDTGCQGVSIRLKAGDDFPFVAHRGLSCERDLDLRGLVVRDSKGSPLHDAEGRPVLAGLCGIVIGGQTHPGLSIFTEGGSCWTNHGQDLGFLASSGIEFCASEQEWTGSVAMIPIRAAGETIGLLQLRDEREGMFSLEIVEILEGVASHLGAALVRRQADQALLESRRQYMSLLSHLPGMAYRCRNDSDWTMEFVSEGALTLTGFDPSDLVDNRTVSFNMLILPQDRARLWELWQQAITDRKVFEAEYQIVTRDRKVKWVWEQGEAVFDEGGGFVALEGFIADITDRKRSLEERERLLAAIEQSSETVVITGASGDIQYVNPAFESVTGYTRQEAIGRNPRILRSGLQAPAFYQHFWSVLLSGKTWRGEWVNRRKDGTFYSELASVSPVLDEFGEITNYVAVKRDITEERKAAANLAESEYRYRTLADSGQALIWTSDRDRKMDWFNRPWLEFTGKTLEQELGDGWTEGVHPEDLSRVVQAYDAAFVLRDPFSIEFRIRNVVGEDRWIVQRATPRFDMAGSFLGYIGHCIDITERRRAEEEREKLQLQFVQAQKMESIGRLAGGVAHDFNNMIQGILGYTELALEQVSKDHPLHSDLSEIQKAAHRSAALTRQLLAFARKQAIVPALMDVNEVVENMLNMLRRLMGDGISLVWEPGRPLAPVFMDAGQIDQVLANLCINARDAIQEGKGRIVISTANVRVDSPDCDIHHEIVPGDYVLLSVSDNGSGIRPELVREIFEPFFSTKERGAGTGLGLSTVYGIVHQNRGGIQVESVVGQGTTFKVLLPRAEGNAHDSVSPSAVDVLPAGRGETILLVDDERLIVQATKRMLESFGYKVLTTQFPEEALSMGERHRGKIDLVLVDVIMPAMNGLELVQRLRLRDPDFKTLFMSGYTANILAKQGIQGSVEHLLQKPFSRQTLSQAVRQALDSPADPAILRSRLSPPAGSVP